MRLLLPDDPETRRWSYALGAICLLAVGLRTLGLAYGLPAVYNPDETPILNRALALAQNLKPQNFVYPSLYFYLLFIWEGLFFVGGRVAGLFDSLGDFQREFFVDPSRLFLVGRFFSMLCGTLTVVAVYRLGKRLYDRATGLAAAMALAVSPIAVRDAHYVKLDVPTTMFVALAHLALARIVVDPEAAAHRRYWILAGLLSGLAVSTQYYAIFVAFTMVGVALADVKRSGNPRDTWRLFLWSTGAAVIGFVVGSPFIPFDLPRVVADVAHVREVDIDRALVGGRFTAVLPYLRILFWDSMGWPIWIAAVAGFVWTLVTDWRRGLLLVSFFIPFFVFLANTVPMSRYLNVVLPLIALAAGFALARIGRRVTSPTRFALLMTLPFIPGLLGSLQWDFFLRQADTRTLAGDFITAQIPAGQSLLVQPYGPPLRQSREGLLEGLRYHLGTEANASTKFQLMLGLSPYPQPSYRLIYFGDKGLDKDKLYVVPAEFSGHDGLEPLRRRGVDYVVLKKSNLPNPEVAGLETALAREGTLIAEFSPYRSGATAQQREATPPFLHNTAAVIQWALERPGPIVEVWAVKANEGRRWGGPGS
ncbi:MAG: ArnT family glycosyltransferase [Vicinamibacterales bacterium]